MMAANIAPGMNRSFLAENWKNLVPRKHWYHAVEEAQDLIDDKIETDIQGYDIDGEVIRAARENARLAGVDHLIHFQKRSVSELNHPKKYGFVITNPPYGERLMEKREAEALYTAFGTAYAKTEHWRLYLLSSHTEFERCFGRRADKKRRFYNGRLECEFMTFGLPKSKR